MTATWKHVKQATDRDHKANPDPVKRASSNGAVTVCLTCNERLRRAA